jgi:hypothetical protein
MTKQAAQTLTWRSAGLICCLALLAPVITQADGMPDDPAGASAVKPKPRSTRAKSKPALSAAQLRTQQEQQAKQDQAMREQAEQQRMVAEANAPLVADDASVEVRGPGRALKKKVVTTLFDVALPGDALDIDDVSRALPAALAESLRKSGSYLPRVAPSLLANGYAGEAPDPNMVRQMADFNDSQFVVSGHVLSTATIVEPKYFGLWETRKRQLSAEVFVYDGYTGALLNKHRIDKVVEKEVKLGRERAFGSEAFQATPVGQALEAMVEEMAAAVRADLGMQPFTAKVLRVTKNELTFDAGAISSITPGDVLGIYRYQRKLPLTNPVRGDVLGLPETMAGSVTVSQVQLNFALGEMSPAAVRNRIQPGDLIRWFPKSQP